MKQEVVDYVAKCLTYQRVKIEHDQQDFYNRWMPHSGNGILCPWILS